MTPRSGAIWRMGRSGRWYRGELWCRVVYAHSGGCGAAYRPGARSRSSCRQSRGYSRGYCSVAGTLLRGYCSVAEDTGEDTVVLGGYCREDTGGVCRKGQLQGGGGHYQTKHRESGMAACHMASLYLPFLQASNAEWSLSAGCQFGETTAVGPAVSCGKITELTVKISPADLAGSYCSLAD